MFADGNIVYHVSGGDGRPKTGIVASVLPVRLTRSLGISLAWPDQCIMWRRSPAPETELDGGSDLSQWI
jgi:hypothetical protein